MAAAQYYSSLDLGKSHIPDNIPLLPTTPAESIEQQGGHQQPEYQFAYRIEPLHASANASQLSAPSHQNDYDYHTSLNEAQSKPTQDTFNPPRFAKFKKYVRFFVILRVLSHGLSSLLNGVIFGLMIFTFGTFTRTKNTVIEAKDAWPRDAKTWPTIMLLVIAVITLFSSVAALISNCVCIRRQRNWRLILLGYGIHILSWAIVTFLYRYEKDMHGHNNDLWGWSCGGSAKELQNNLRSDIDFSLLCNVQVSFSWPLESATALTIAVKLLDLVNN